MSSRFSTLLALGDPDLDLILAALAEELGAPDASASRGRLGLLVEELDEALCDPASQLDQLGEHVAGAFQVVRDGHRRTDIEDLRPDSVLQTGAGDELVVAALVAAAGQRRGWPVRVVLGKKHVVVGHTELPAALVLSPRHDGRLIDANDLCDKTLAWCCPHEVAAALLTRVDRRAARLGRRDLIVQARELTLALPLGEQDMAARRVELARARSAWN